MSTCSGRSLGFVGRLGFDELSDGLRCPNPGLRSALDQRRDVDLRSDKKVNNSGCDLFTSAGLQGGFQFGFLRVAQLAAVRLLHGLNGGLVEFLHREAGGILHQLNAAGDALKVLVLAHLAQQPRADDLDGRGRERCGNAEQRDDELNLDGFH